MARAPWNVKDAAVGVRSAFQAYSPGPDFAKELAKAIEMLLNHRDLTLQDPETVAAALELFRAKPTLGFSDCLTLQLARKAGHLPLGTFDRNLARADGAQKLWNWA